MLRRLRMQTHWFETVDDAETQRMINVHEGHSWDVAKEFYTFHDQKKSGQCVSSLVSRDMEVGFVLFVLQKSQILVAQRIFFHRFQLNELSLAKKPQYRRRGHFVMSQRK